MSIMASFLKELRVIDKCLWAYGFSDWNSAISTVKMMHLNQARMTGYRSFEDQLKMAEVVDSFILDTHLYHSTNETVSNILKLFSKRCIHWNGVLNADQVDRLIKKLPAKNGLTSHTRRRAACTGRCCRIKSRRD
ncbi:hypothetical protein PRIPAC_74112 [Pristionchus pacificus]|uniref:Uncharacterized protein n=1 Tax=Pristionchus pacificus TaxID=54126 RepID=A0A2A6C1D1_PRIPA|nr:hypothetical protein PRIPAC_74112 [Pristionchus pacificus]|eukprot:PDM72062.1 hypothetical protein PRIPAC_38469 [Pristionchus pacificus]